MKNLINKVLSITKFILLIISFVGIMYILLNNYKFLDKNIDFKFILILLPFIVLIAIIFLSYTLKINVIKNNLLYNSISNISLVSILYILYRTMFDKNMIYYYKDGYNINFKYFNEQIIYIKVIIYLMIIIYILLMISSSMKKEKIG